MLIVNNPSVNKIEIVNRGRRLTINAKQTGQKLDVEADKAKALQDSLKKSHPYLTFDEPAKEPAKAPEAPAPVPEPEPAKEPAKAPEAPTTKRGSK